MSSKETPIKKVTPSIRAEDGHVVPRVARERQESPHLAGNTSAAANQSGLSGDLGGKEEKQDAPGRPKSASSRQQTIPDQATQTSSTQLDRS